MIRKIIHIDEEKCTGCGACAKACHEGAIGMVGGRAKLLRDDYCDGLGDCLPTCPAEAITFVEREAAPYDQAAVAAGKILAASAGLTPDPTASACPGTRARPAAQRASALSNWPVQLKLAPIQAPFYQNASLLVAADCSAFACAAFHEDYIRGRVALIGCPKLDGADYAEKLAQIFSCNPITDVLVVRMEVPCCGGLEQAVKNAIARSGKDLPCRVVTLSTGGRVLE